ncbi:hypothetical protein VP01_158g4 [Puccinia sorghi]|uniref:Uncharacterized protein n=1 Tax=Puccinia sorghi TaxID=27349 RepID=A0A0L6VJB6_9BASI|nr:hypothetical protein VP01_158g4 [Puccinia sorghi]
MIHLKSPLLSPLGYWSQYPSSLLGFSKSFSSFYCQFIHILVCCSPHKSRRLTGTEISTAKLAYELPSYPQQYTWVHFIFYILPGRSMAKHVSTFHPHLESFALIVSHMIMILIFWKGIVNQVLCIVTGPCEKVLCETSLWFYDQTLNTKNEVQVVSNFSETLIPFKLYVSKVPAKLTGGTDFPDEPHMNRATSGQCKSARMNPLTCCKVTHSKGVAKPTLQQTGHKRCRAGFIQVVLPPQSLITVSLRIFMICGKSGGRVKWKGNPTAHRERPFALRSSRWRVRMRECGLLAKPRCEANAEEGSPSEVYGIFGAFRPMQLAIMGPSRSMSLGSEESHGPAISGWLGLDWHRMLCAFPSPYLLHHRDDQASAYPIERVVPLSTTRLPSSAPTQHYLQDSLQGALHLKQLLPRNNPATAPLISSCSSRFIIYSSCVKLNNLFSPQASTHPTPQDHDAQPIPHQPCYSFVSLLSSPCNFLITHHACPFNTRMVDSLYILLTFNFTLLFCSLAPFHHLLCSRPTLRAYLFLNRLYLDPSPSSYPMSSAIPRLISLGSFFDTSGPYILILLCDAAAIQPMIWGDEMRSCPRCAGRLVQFKTTRACTQRTQECPAIFAGATADYHHCAEGLSGQKLLSATLLIWGNSIRQEINPFKTKHLIYREAAGKHLIRLTQPEVVIRRHEKGKKNAEGPCWKGSAGKNVVGKKNKRNIMNKTKCSLATGLADLNEEYKENIGLDTYCLLVDQYAEDPFQGQIRSPFIFYVGVWFCFSRHYHNCWCLLYYHLHSSPSILSTHYGQLAVAAGRSVTQSLQMNRHCNALYSTFIVFSVTHIIINTNSCHCIPLVLTLVTQKISWHLLITQTKSNDDTSLPHKINSVMILQPPPGLARGFPNWGIIFSLRTFGLDSTLSKTLQMFAKIERVYDTNGNLVKYNISQLSTELTKYMQKDITLPVSNNLKLVRDILQGNFKYSKFSVNSISSNLSQGASLIAFFLPSLSMINTSDNIYKVLHELRGIGEKMVVSNMLTCYYLVTPSRTCQGFPQLGSLRTFVHSPVPSRSRSRLPSQPTCCCSPPSLPTQPVAATLLLSPPLIPVHPAADLLPPLPLPPLVPVHPAANSLPSLPLVHPAADSLPLPPPFDHPTSAGQLARSPPLPRSRSRRLLQPTCCRFPLLVLPATSRPPVACPCLPLLTRLFRCPPASRSPAARHTLPSPLTLNPRLPSLHHLSN